MKSVRHRRRNIIWHPLYAESKNKWYKWTYLQNRPTDLMNLWLPGWKDGEGTVKEFGISIYTLLYLKQIINKVLPCNTGNFIQCYIAAWMGEELGGDQTYMLVYCWVPWLSTWNHHNIINWLYPNTKYKLLSKEKATVFYMKGEGYLLQLCDVTVLSPLPQSLFFF